MPVTPALAPFWVALPPEADAEQPDVHVAFRGTFELAEPQEVEIRLLGASWYTVWLDGVWLAEGPLRFARAYPEVDEARIALPAGRHVIASQVQYYGVETGLLVNMPPFFSCTVHVAGQPLPVEWKGQRLGGYASQLRRLSPVFGWAEFCDTREQPARWRELDFDDSSWPGPVPSEPGIGEPRPPTIAPVQSFVLPLQPIADGFMANAFGYENDDPPVRFFLRDLECLDLPPQGVWRRYDLGLVRLGRPKFVLDLPAGAVVEFGYSEILRQGRVSPWMTLASFTCYVDRYIARGGPQEFMPMAPRGMRYLEVHVRAEPSSVRFLREEFLERSYHGDPEGRFECEDALLNRVWKAGIDTYRACTEDAILDCPTRERGQWIGDLVGAGMEIASLGYRDTRLVRRALVQAAQCARAEGMVAGLCPQKAVSLSTYAAQWATAVLHYWELSGDRALLDELFDAAERSFADFERFVSDDGLSDCDAWAFVDWGYVRNEGPVDIAVNMHFVESVRSMVRWCREVGREDRAAHYHDLERRIAAILRRWLDAAIAVGWEAVGFQRSALALRLGLLRPDEEGPCVASMKAHMMNCFPNDASAPRLSDPDMANPRLITPYFAHYALTPLIDQGEMDFVLDQFRTCWGWALSKGITTSLEVFDTRWSHCHQWAACPTWQLSRYVLGLHPRFDRGVGRFDFRLIPGSLHRASGKIPLPGSPRAIEVQWTRDEEAISFTLETPSDIWLGERRVDAGERLVLSLESSEGSWAPTGAA